MNNVIISGNITRDLELRYTANQMCVVKFTLAVSRMKKDETDFINCVAFDKTGETMAKFLGKGRKIIVSGHIQTGSYQPEGSDKKVYTTDVIVDRFEFADSKHEGKNEKPSEENQGGFVPVDIDDSQLPF